tara:strand:+ start:32 stop:484 length:453 start_codon:yes stop_codon:yes gene_type:complete
MNTINDLIEVLDMINNLEKDNKKNSSKEINDVINHLIDEYNKNNLDNYQIDYVYLDKKLSNKIKKNFIKNLGKYQKIKNTDDVLKNNQQCSICREKFQEGEYKRILPHCFHIYHKKCIDNWLKNDENRSCPLCRKSFEDLYKKCEKKMLE